MYVVLKTGLSCVAWITYDSLKWGSVPWSYLNPISVKIWLKTRQSPFVSYISWSKILEGGSKKNIGPKNIKKKKITADLWKSRGLAMQFKKMPFLAKNGVGPRRGGGRLNFFFMCRVFPRHLPHTPPWNHVWL